MLGQDVPVEPTPRTGGLSTTSDRRATPPGRSGQEREPQRRTRTYRVRDLAQGPGWGARRTSYAHTIVPRIAATMHARFASHVPSGTRALVRTDREE